MDRTGGPRTGLASYYTEKGETPGAWVGLRDGRHRRPDASGTRSPRSRCRPCSGAGLHPLAAAARASGCEGPDLTERDFQAVTRLGVPFKVYDGDVTAVPGRGRHTDRGAERRRRGTRATTRSRPQDRARIRTEVAAEMFRAEHGRDPRDARELAATIAKLPGRARPRSPGTT